MYPLRKMALSLQWQWLSTCLTVDDGGIVVGLGLTFTFRSLGFVGNELCSSSHGNVYFHRWGALCCFQLLQTRRTPYQQPNISPSCLAFVHLLLLGAWFLNSWRERSSVKVILLSCVPKSPYYLDMDQNPDFSFVKLSIAGLLPN